MSQLEETKQAVKYLKAARKLITPEGSWCKGHLARDIDNKAVGVFDKRACRFCSLGAAYKVIGAKKFYALTYDILSFAFSGSIGVANDKRSTKHPHVLMAYDFAILHAEDEVKRLKKLEKALG